MGAGNLKQVSPTECRCPFDKTSFDLQRKTRGAKCNGRGSPGNGHTSSTNQTGVAMHRNLFQVFKLFHHLGPLLIAGSTTKIRFGNHRFNFQNKMGVNFFSAILDKKGGGPRASCL